MQPAALFGKCRPGGRGHGAGRAQPGGDARGGRFQDLYDHGDDAQRPHGPVRVGCLEDEQPVPSPDPLLHPFLPAARSEWLVQELGEAAVAKHMVAVSTNLKLVE